MDLINKDTGEVRGYKSPFEEMDYSEQISDANDNIIYGYGYETKDEEFGHYHVPLECVNCRSRFLGHEPERDGDYYGFWIQKGTKIADLKCPICGCETLRVFKEISR